MEHPEAGRFEEKERDLIDELNKLRSQCLPRGVIDQLIQEIEESSDRLGRDSFEQAIGNVVKRMGAEGMEPGNLGVYEEAETLLADSDSKLDRLIEEDVTGTYNPITDKIALRDFSSISDWPEFYIEQLANDGYGENDAILHHELIHSFQWSEDKKGRLMDVAKDLFSFYGQGYKTRKMLRELHAQIGGHRFTGPQSTKEYYKILLSGYDVISNKQDIRSMIMAIKQLKSLYALGLGDKEIGGLIKKASWDPKKRTFDVLDGKTQEIMSVQGVQEKDLEKMVLNEDIKAQIYVEKIKLMAQEEIKNIHEKIALKPGSQEL